METRLEIAFAEARIHRLDFGNGVETEYRRSVKRLRRWPLLGLFVTFGLIFSSAPLYQQAIFGVSAHLGMRLRALQLLFVAPLMFMGALVTYLDRHPPVTSAIQKFGVATVVVVAVMLRGLALDHQMYFPSSMVGVVVIAITIFGRFNWYGASLCAVGVLVVAGVQEWLLLGSGPNCASTVYSFTLMALVAVMGAYVIELNLRRTWIKGRSARLMAATDALTGLSSRIEFNRVLPRTFRQAARDRRLIAVSVIDIDQFKRINDTHGHLIGDAALKAVGAALLTIASRPLDIAVRFGGDELVMVWYDITLETLPAQVDELLLAIRNIRLVATPESERIRITASIGTVWLTPKTRTDPDEVLRQADHLMYSSKRAGRDRAQIAPYRIPDKAKGVGDTVDH